MITIINVAFGTGVRTKQARRFAQQVGVTVQDRVGTSYALRRRTAPRSRPTSFASIEEGSSPELPLSALAHTPFRDAFTLKKWERNVV